MTPGPVDGFALKNGGSIMLHIGHEFIQRATMGLVFDGDAVDIVAHASHFTFMLLQQGTDVAGRNHGAGPSTHYDMAFVSQHGISLVHRMEIDAKIFRQSTHRRQHIARFKLATCQAGNDLPTQLLI